MPLGERFPARNVLLDKALDKCYVRKYEGREVAKPADDEDS